MYSLTVRDHIMVAHSLPAAFFGPAQGLHGATLVVEATWRVRELDEHAVVMDIGEAGRILGEVLAPLNYRNLDEHPAFIHTFSTTEAIAGHISESLRTYVDEARFAGLDIVVREHPDAWAGYSVDFDASAVAGG